jgi:hypothetical protein
MSKETGPTLSDVVSAATFAIAVITAWLYTVGWTYAYQYFIQFRIPLLLIFCRCSTTSSMARLFCGRMSG